MTRTANGRDIRSCRACRPRCEQLDAPNDLDDIQTFAEIIKKYGYDQVKEANDLTRGLKKGSSRRDVQMTERLLR